MKKLLLILSSILIATSVFAQIGTFDPTFNNGGSLQTVNYASNAKIIPLTNETALHINNVGMPGTPGDPFGEENAYVNKLTNDLSTIASTQSFVHPGFGNTIEGIRDFIIDANGKTVVAGSKQYDAMSYSSIYIGRYNADGTYDNTFNSGSFYEVDFSTSSMHTDVFKILQLSSGKLMCIGKRAGNANLLIRINSDGTIDNTYGTNGIYTWNFMGGSYSKIHDAIELSNGKMLVAGSEYDPMNNNIQTAFVARLNADGTIDNTFGESGVARVTLGQNDKASYITSMALTSNGSIIVGGMGYWTGSQSWDVARGGFVKLSADGVYDATFGTHSIPSDYSGINKVRVTANDEIIAGGHISLSSIQYSLFVFLTSAGAFNTQIDTDGMITESNFPNAQVQDFAFQPDGKMIYVKSFYMDNFNTGLVVGRMLMAEGTNSIEETNENQIVVYPNPTNGTTTITVAKPTSISVRTINGTEILTTTVESQKTIDLSGFAAGVYFIHTEEGQTVKVIKE